MEYRDVLNETGSIFFFRVFEMKVTEDILPQNLGRKFPRAQFCTPF